MVLDFLISLIYFLYFCGPKRFLSFSFSQKFLFSRFLYVIIFFISFILSPGQSTLLSMEHCFWLRFLENWRKLTLWKFLTHRSWILLLALFPPKSFLVTLKDNRLLFSGCLPSPKFESFGTRSRTLFVSPFSIAPIDNSLFWHFPKCNSLPFLLWKKSDTPKSMNFSSRCLSVRMPFDF